MASSFNRVILLGNLTRDPELRHTPGGTPVADIGLAIAPHSGVASFLGKELSAVPIKGRPLARELGLVTLKERDPSPAASGLMSLLRTNWNKTLR